VAVLDHHLRGLGIDLEALAAKGESAALVGKSLEVDALDFTSTSSVLPPLGFTETL